MAAPPALRIELLGGFALLAGRRPAARPLGARQQQLIALLVLQGRGKPISRQRAAGSLWPDSTNAQALTNLRRELHHLRDEWPKLDALVEARSGTLAWRDKPSATVDLIAFESAGERGLAGNDAALRAAADLYKGDLLPDCTSEWIEADRRRLRQRAGAVLTRLTDVLEGERAFGDAIEYAHRLLRLDPLDEQAWCALMRCHARRGERATALHLYQQCSALLRKELGIQPSEATRTTYRAILDVDEAAPNAVPPPRMAGYQLVGRQVEWQALQDAWRAAVGGQPLLCLVRGEAGIGKTRLAEELVESCTRAGTVAITARCYAGDGRLPYAPIAAWLKNDALRPTLLTLDSGSLIDIARLRPDLLLLRPDLAAPARHLESWQRVRFFEALAAAFRSASPLLLFIEDLQWADGDTIAWLQYFLRAAAGTRCLIVGTVRAEEEQDNPPLARMLDGLSRDGQLAVIALGPLDQAATAQLAGQVAEQPVDELTLARVFRETEGHPLFIVERGRMAAAQQGEAPADDVPPRVQAVVAMRLALLSADALAVAEIAAAVGRDFQFDILAHASDLEEDALVRALDELWRRQIVRVREGERWDFSHDRIREVAYGGLGPARRRLIHRRIAQGMELLFANRLDDVSASIALHLERGGLPAPAVPFLERAAAAATRVSANEEAVRCLTQALALLDQLPAGRERDRRELALRAGLSVALNSARGYAAPEVEQNLDRVFILVRADSGSQVPVRWLWAAFALRFVLGDVRRAHELSVEALERSASDPSCLCDAHHAMAATSLSTGNLEIARHHFEAALAAYDERRPRQSALGSDLGVFVRVWYAQVLWLLGDEPAAITQVEQGTAFARRLDHRYSETLALAYAGLLHQMRRDAGCVLACARAVVNLCDRHGFAYYGDWAHVLIGWARGQEEPHEGIDIIESALARLDIQRAQARRPYYLSLLAEAYDLAGNPVRAAAILDAAITMAIERTDVWWLPALLLQKSNLEPQPTRETTRQMGLDLARAQRSRSLEQRLLASG